MRLARHADRQVEAPGDRPLAARAAPPELRRAHSFEQQLASVLAAVDRRHHRSPRGRGQELGRARRATAGRDRQQTRGRGEEQLLLAVAIEIGGHEVADVVRQTGRQLEQLATAQGDERAPAALATDQVHDLSPARAPALQRDAEALARQDHVAALGRGQGRRAHPDRRRWFLRRLGRRRAGERGGAGERQEDRAARFHGRPPDR